MDEGAPARKLTVRAYWIVVVAVFLGLTLGSGLYERGVQMTCWAGGYKQDAWMAYCNSDRYGVYDVQAIWHHSEPDVWSAVRRAKVLTLSDSHLQNAFSLGDASGWFAARHYPLYMLGLPTEQSGFGERLLDNFNPHPAVVILDASPYFTGDVGSIEHRVFDSPDASLKEVLALGTFQAEHEHFCSVAAWACGHNFAYFRSRQDGHWIFPQPSNSIWVGGRSVPNDRERHPTGTSPNEVLPLYSKYLANARRLVEKLHIPRECIVITHVPAADDLRSLAEYLGSSLGVTVIDPEVPNLATFDNAHLTPESSLRWTQAFLGQLEPLLQRCAGARPDLVSFNSWNQAHAPH